MNKNMRESFIFYASFARSLAKKSPKLRLKMFDSIVNYAIYEQNPSFNDIKNKKTKEELESLWELIKPQLAANTKRYKDGKKGGRPSEENKTTGYKNKKPNKNDNENGNDNENDNDNDNDNDNVTVFDYYQKFIGTISSSCWEKINSWYEVFPEEVLKYAIDKAVDSQVFRWDYVEGILINWQNAKLSTLEEIKQKEKRNNKKSNETEEERLARLEKELQEANNGA